nr:hypothetical protein [Tanacetum cinerariifolium]
YHAQPDNQFLRPRREARKRIRQPTDALAQASQHARQVERLADAVTELGQA